VSESEDNKLLNLVAALALLDTDFRQHKGPGAAKPSDDAEAAWSGLHGRRWNSGVLMEMWGKNGIQEIQNGKVYRTALELLGEPLPGNSPAGEAL